MMQEVARFIGYTVVFLALAFAPALLSNTLSGSCTPSFPGAAPAVGDGQD